MSQQQELLHIGHYIMGKTIGRGGFAKVKQAIHDLTNSKVAIKIINKTRMKNVNMISKVKRQIKILKYINHPNIIKLYQVLDTTSDIYVVMEMAQGGELFQYIQNNQMTEEEVKIFFRQIVNGVQFSHKNLVSHRDLKPENIILNSKKQLKIADFGLSNLMKDGRLLKTFCGSLNYAAPEIIGHRMYEGTSVDIWSCGIILFTMLTSSLPFDQQVVQVLYRKIERAEYEIPSYVNPLAGDLIRKMLQVNPVNRIRISQIKNHPWLRETIPIYCKIPSNYFSRKDISFVVDKQVLSKIQNYNMESLNKVKDFQRLKKILKKRLDESFVVAYQMLKDEKQCSQKTNYSSEQEDKQGNIFNEISNKINRKRIQPENNHIFGKIFQINPKILIQIIFKIFYKLKIEFIIKNNQYRVLCNYTQKNTRIFRKQSERDSDTIYQQTQQSQKICKIHYRFNMQLYSKNDKNHSTVVDFHLTQGHPIVFINLVDKIYKQIVRELQLL